MSEAAEFLGQIYNQFLQESKLGVIPHHKNLIIDASPDPVPFQVAAYPFQWERLKKLAPAFEWVCGLRNDYDGPSGFWEVARRGMDKTSGLARLMNWVLLNSPRYIQATASASDGRQVGFLVDAMKKDALLNPWMGDYLKFTGSDEKAKIMGPGGVLNIQPANSKGAYGARQDLVIMDEVGWWNDTTGKELFDAILSGRQKRPVQLTLIISNAGIIDSWQWKAFQEFKKLDYWSVYEFPAKVKTWMNQDRIDQERRLLTPGTAKRVFDNVWINASEDSGYLTPEEIEAAFDLGKRMGLRKRTLAEPGKRYVACVDYGAVKDRTALWIGHLEKPLKDVGPILVTDALEVWCGSPNDPVKLSKVKDWIKKTNIDFNRPVFVVDQHQMEGVIQELETYVNIERFNFRGGQANFQMAELVKSLFADNRVAFYDRCGVISSGESMKEELGALVIERKTGLSYRFDHKKLKHDDRTVAMGMGCMKLFSDPIFTPMGKVPTVNDDKNPKIGLHKLIDPKKSLGIWGKR